MEEKLNAIMNNEALVKEIFSGSVEEAREKLAANGVALNEDEFNALLAGISDVVNAEGELDEENLDTVAGGHGPKVGFFHGFFHGAKNDKYKDGGSRLYQLGSKCGQIICGHANNW